MRPRRGTLSDVAFDTDRLVQEIKGFPKDVDVIFRGHSLEDLLSGLDLGCTVVPKEIESNEVLAITDILITDYSSIFFDFIPRNKPIILYVYDEEAYEAERGMYFPIEDMPGLKVRSHAALVKTLTELARAPDLRLDGYEAARARFCPHEDGQACARTAAFFFDDAPEARVEHLDDKTNVLIHPGSLHSNGITTAFVNLHHALRDSPCRLVTLFSPAGPENDRDRREQFDKLEIGAAYVPRFGYAVESFEEGYLRKQQSTRWSGPLEGERAEVLARFHGREYRRIMGGAKVDTVVSYSGYDTFFQDVLASAGPGVRRIAVLHNQMLLEFTTRFPELVRNFETLSRFDVIASVSRHTSALNRTNLAPTFGIPPERFVPIDNMLDIAQVTHLAEAAPPEDLAGIFGGARPVFLSIGRLSIEKDHAKLIHAFQRLLHTTPRARLVILGEGPLRLTLEQQIRDLRLEGRVLLPWAMWPIPIPC
ncbi:MAG: CDP-glycerol glycerophosphotransferase family protein [Gemmobacter sp.]|nr:CDP-glycerol glycerophosphotransferase family protein [Gemmobacter sp.]